MRNIYRCCALIMIVALLESCESGVNDRMNYMANTEMVEVPITAQEAPSIAGRKLIRTGFVEFETEDMDSTRTKVMTAVQKRHGYLSDDRQNNSPGRISVTMTIRVPADHFNDLLSEATQGVKRLDRKEINVNDATEEFVDIEARLKTKKELEARYLELLEKATAVKDILEIETQIGTLRADIESIEGRLKYLDNQVAYSTLTIAFYKKISRHAEFSGRFENGFRNGWENLIWFFVFLVNIWPFLLMIIAAVLGIRMVRKRRKNKIFGKI